ncbi:TRAP transporter small permease [Metabacillus litoralis]|uniref:TRAP transporter small permease n=1 Tax=Metabacillus litoralis TaxID=152268 RepID=UPI00203B7385|nr:TRAP transporter small permease [Metabacillus litoralis]MCM3412725.1 TRAP transporter small permease [Metabacillus litoralis]
MNPLKWVTRILSFLAILSLSGVIIVVTIQILSRYFPYSFIWTEELTRYFFLFAICFGAPLALLRNEYINVDLIISKLSTKVRRFYEIGIYVLILLLSAVMVREGYNFMELGRTQSSATMPIQMNVIHSSIFIMGIFLLIFSIIRIAYLVRNKKNPYEVNGGGEI